jgi:hypothetical protein
MVKRAARPVLGPSRQARLENRAVPSKHAGSISCSSPARSGPKPEKVGRKAGLTGLEVNGSCRASPPCLVSCPSLARLFVPGQPGPA